MDDRQPVRHEERKLWNEPEIVLERSLVAAAQGGGPSQPNFGGPPSGFLAPLGVSPNTPGGNCG